MRSFPRFQDSRAAVFTDLSAGDTCLLRIPLDWLEAAASPTVKPGKQVALPSVTRNRPHDQVGNLIVMSFRMKSISLSKSMKKTDNPF